MQTKLCVTNAAIKPGQFCRASKSFGLIDSGVYRYEGTRQGIAYLTAGADVVGICSSFLKYFSEVKSKGTPQSASARQQDYKSFLINKLSQHGANWAELETI